MSNEKNINKKLEMDIFDLIILISNQYKKIFVITLLSMLCWFIYYTSHTAQFETYAFVSPGENINFRYDNITNEYLEDKDLTVEEISRQFENNAMDYVLFDEFFSNQNKVEFNDIDDLYASFSKNTSDGKTKYSFIYNDYKFDDMEELISNYMIYIHKITLNNILEILSKELLSINISIDNISVKDQLEKAILKQNDQYLLSKNALQDRYGIEKGIKIVSENLSIAKELGYIEPVGNIESYFLSSLSPLTSTSISISPSTSVDGSNQGTEKRELLQSKNKNNFASNETPLFFLGERILIKYLEILNNDLENIELNLSKNYPSLFANNEIKNTFLKKKYIEELTEFEILKMKIERVYDSFYSMKENPTLVKFNFKKVKTINVETSYFISFVISIIFGILMSIVYIVVFEMIKRKKYQ